MVPSLRRLLPLFFLFAACACVPAAVRAATLDDLLTCRESAHDFVSTLLQNQWIEPHPMRVESNSINAFWPVRGTTLTAYGFSVFAIVGFQQNDPLFHTGKGTPIARSAYGAVVFGRTPKVAAALNAAGNPAIVHHVGPLLTAIFCQQD